MASVQVLWSSMQIPWMAGSTNKRSGIPCEGQGTVPETTGKKARMKLNRFRVMIIIIVIEVIVLIATLIHLGSQGKL